MKKGILLFTALLVTIWNFGQDERITLNEVNLGEKHNQILRGLPEILLKAYCKGEISAYYPKYLKAKVSFSEFLNYSDIEDPSYNEQGLLCPNEYCDINKEDLKMFNKVLEFVEIEKRAQVGQEPSKIIYYIRLKIKKKDFYLNEDKYYNGPVFFTRDILALGEKYKLFNPKNDAAPLSIKKVILARIFTSSIIKDFTDVHFDRNNIRGKSTGDDLYEY